MHRSFTLLAIAAALLVGCGDTSPEDFVDQVEELMRPVEKAARAGPDPANVKALAETLDTAADRLSALDVPDGTEDEVARVVAKLHEGAVLYGDASAALASGSEADFEAVRVRARGYESRLSEATEALGEAIDHPTTGATASEGSRSSRRPL